MNRSAVLKRLATMPLVPTLLPLLPTAVQTTLPSTSFARRVRPSDPSWPSAANWEKLKQQVGGHLTSVQSPLAVCHVAPDSASCQDVLKNLKNPYYIGEQPGGTQTSGWVDEWTPAASVYAVAVRKLAGMGAV